MKPRIYIAAPLFSEAEREFNKRVKHLLLPYFGVYLPQEDGGLMVDMIAAGISPQDAAQHVFQTDVNALETCNIMLIILDGRSIDEGAAFELGFAFARGKQCVALRTDPRQLLATGNNPMIESAVCQTFTSLDTLLEWANKVKDNNLTKENATKMLPDHAISVPLLEARG